MSTYLKAGYSSTRRVQAAEPIPKPDRDLSPMPDSFREEAHRKRVNKELFGLFGPGVRTPTPRKRVFCSGRGNVPPPSSGGGGGHGIHFSGDAASAAKFKVSSSFVPESAPLIPLMLASVSKSKRDGQPRRDKESGSIFALSFHAFFVVVPCGVVFVIVGMLERGDDVCEYGVSTLLKRIKSRKNGKKMLRGQKQRLIRRDGRWPHFIICPKLGSSGREGFKSGGRSAGVRTGRDLGGIFNRGKWISRRN